MVAPVPHTGQSSDVAGLSPLSFSLVCFLRKAPGFPALPGTQIKGFHQLNIKCAFPVDFTCTQQHCWVSFLGSPACSQQGWPSVINCSITSSSTGDISQSLCCHLSRKVIAIKDAAFSAAYVTNSNMAAYLLVFKAPCISYCYPNWKACAVRHSLYKCHSLEIIAVAFYIVCIKNKSLCFQLYIYAGFLPDLFSDLDHGGVRFHHLLLCKGKQCVFFVESFAEANWISNLFLQLTEHVLLAILSTLWDKGYRKSFDKTEWTANRC